MTAYAALLRAINVGGSGTLRMADLKAICSKLGFKDVATLLQSGNVVFTATGTDAAIARKLADAIEAGHGFRPAISVRTAAELAAIVGDNPFPKEAKDGTRVIVAFAAAKPSAGAAERVAAVKGAKNERLVLVGRDLFIHYPDGQGRSKVTNAVIERALGVPVTSRNWNTVTKLAAMTAAPKAGS